MIYKPEQHDIDRAGERMLRGAFEPLGWIVNKVERDYGIDFNVQVFVEGSPNGLWFTIQLKSSSVTRYSQDRSFISEPLDLDHARHYASELREPVFLVHADVSNNKLFWHAPQTDLDLTYKLSKEQCPQSVTVRIPARNSLPDTAPALLQAVGQIHLVLANRRLAESSSHEFIASLTYHPDEKQFRNEFQQKHDILKLRAIHELFVDRRFPEAKQRADLILADPDAALESKFSALKIPMPPWVS